MTDVRTARLIGAALVALASFTLVPQAAAGVVVNGTRVVYPAAKREVTISLQNAGPAPSLVQAWLDTGDVHSQPGQSKVPFVLTPPLFRLDPTKMQSLRLVYTHDPLPGDRESLFWLNVLDIPPRAAANPDLPNQLDLAFKHRMKVFFRPVGLSGSAADAPGKLTWSLQSKNGRLVGIQATNPTPYHVSLTQITATVNGHPVTVKADMVDPFASRSFDLPDLPTAPAGATAVEYWFVNDYGGNVNGTASASAAP
ncbi:MAG TPA: fimbria/pilus periplasmic chaperone [Steroidobacteraceae bacterium]|nr:fimbria/pilus periplasmic chaperone [Steroidobacteraceae bacterium]